MTGTAGQLRVPMRFIENFSISFPSLTLQTQIVSAIESKFSIIDKVEQIVNQSLLKSEQLRKSILKMAFEGRLVKPMEIKIKNWWKDNKISYIYLTNADRDMIGDDWFKRTNFLMLEAISDEAYLYKLSI